MPPTSFGRRKVAIAATPYQTLATIRRSGMAASATTMMLSRPPMVPMPFGCYDQTRMEPAPSETRALGQHQPLELAGEAAVPATIGQISLLGHYQLDARVRSAIEDVLNECAPNETWVLSLDDYERSTDLCATGPQAKARSAGWIRKNEDQQGRFVYCSAIFSTEYEDDDGAWIDLVQKRYQEFLSGRIDNRGLI